MKHRIIFRSALAVTIGAVGLASAAAAQYGDMPKEAGTEKLKDAVNQGAPPAPAAGADMKGAAAEGGKAADDSHGKPAVPGVAPAPTAGADDADK